MAARAVLVAASVALCVLLAAGLRSARLISEAEQPFSANDRVELERRRDLLDRARLLSPDTTPDVRDAQILVIAHRDRQAVRVLEGVVRREPENYEAWLALRQAAFRVDPQLLRRATREALGLNPLARKRARQ